jgi:hypothetical protein
MSTVREVRAQADDTQSSKCISRKRQIQAREREIQKLKLGSGPDGANRCKRQNQRVRAGNAAARGLGLVSG